MSQPELLTKLFENDGAGPKLKEEIVPQQSVDTSAIEERIDGLEARLEEYMPLSGGQFAAGYFGTSVSGASDIDASAGSIFAKSLGSDWSPSFTGAVGAACVTLVVTSNGHSVTWPSTVKWAGGEAPELTADGTDVLSFISPDSGATWYGAVNMKDAR